MGLCRVFVYGDFDVGGGIVLTSLDLFSGYGGISYGLRDYVKPIAYCEIDRYARAILASRISEGELPFAPIFPDVRQLQGQVNSADIITGGFPCQDISVAGLGKGLAGERSGLFYEIVRLTREIRPTFVFLENVPAIRTRGLRQVVGAFTEIGYDCRWMCLSASSVGAPHKRERWFLLAHTDSELSRNKRKNKVSKNWEMDKRQTITDNNGVAEFMAHADSTRLQGFAESETSWSRQSRRFKTSDEGLSNRTWWTTEPNVGRVVNGAPFRVDRIKAIGNGVVPLQVKTAFEKLVGISEDKK